MRRLSFLLVLFLTVSSIAWASGVKKKKPRPYEFGSVTINNYSQQAGISPVVFDHWLHRAKFTCRICHVDIAFAMKTGFGTDASSAIRISSRASK